MRQPKLIRILSHMMENQGEIPKEFEHLIPFLERRAIIWKVTRNNGKITAKITPAHEHYYRQYVRRKTGWFRWMFRAIYALAEPDNRLMLKTDAELLEKENAPTLGPAIDVLDWQA